MNPKHIVGPWEVRPDAATKNNHISCLYIADANGEKVVRITETTHITATEQDHARAKLIAASPEMADFIHRICTFTGYTHEIFGVEDSIADAERFSALMEEGRNLIARITQ